MTADTDAIENVTLIHCPPERIVRVDVPLEVRGAGHGLGRSRRPGKLSWQAGMESGSVGRILCCWQHCAVKQLCLGDEPAWKLWAEL